MSSTSKNHLLLLPPTPTPPTYAAFKAAYNAPISILLRNLHQKLSQGTATKLRLYIAIACPHLWDKPDAPRSQSFNETQAIVACLYKLIAIISAQSGFDVEGVGGVDVRVLLLRYPRDGKLSRINSSTTTTAGKQRRLGPILQLESLAACSLNWETIYGVQCEEGESLLSDFLRLASTTNLDVQRLRGGTLMVVPPSSDAGSSTGSRRHYSVANGGTYDHLHIGHKLLLIMTAFALDQDQDESPEDKAENRKRVITIGITAEDLLKNKKYAEFLETWEERYQIVHEFLQSILLPFPAEGKISLREKNESGPNGHAVIATFPENLEIRYVEIWDACGPTITDREITALVLSEETRGGGQFVNNERSKKDMPPLDVFEISVLDADEPGEGVDTGHLEQAEGVQKQFLGKLSSTEIRKAQSERAKGRSKV